MICQTKYCRRVQVIYFCHIVFHPAFLDFNSYAVPLIVAVANSYAVKL